MRGKCVGELAAAGEPVNPHIPCFVTCQHLFKFLAVCNFRQFFFLIILTTHGVLSVGEGIRVSMHHSMPKTFSTLDHQL